MKGRVRAISSPSFMYFRLTRIISWITFFATLALLGTVVVAIDPSSLNPVGKVLVFGLAFLWVASGLLVLLLALGLRFLGPARATLYQGAALRQSLLLASFFSAILLAQYARVLTWWGAGLGLTLTLLLELSLRKLFSPKR